MDLNKEMTKPNAFSCHTYWTFDRYYVSVSYSFITYKPLDIIINVEMLKEVGATSLTLEQKELLWTNL